MSYREEKLEKVLCALNGSTPVFTRKKGGERILWKLSHQKGVVPYVKSGPTKQIQQGWKQILDDTRVLVHYIEGFGWIEETKIHVPCPAAKFAFGPLGCW